jgi:hypothetical protein
MRKDARFAAPWAGKDEDGSLDRLNGLFLLGIQV